MSIFTVPNAPSKPDDVTADTSPSIQENERDLRTATVNTQKQPLAHLLNYVEGQRWSVDYYSQVLERDDAPQPLAPTLDATLQQYHQIRRFELIVQSPLQFSYESSRQSEFVEGSAVITSVGVVPCRFDMFVADVGDGRLLIFTLQTVEPRSILGDRAYEVTYKSIVTSPELLDNLKNKVIRSSWYSNDFLQHGKSPILTHDQLVTKKSLESIGYTLIDNYGKEFISPLNNHLVLPDQLETTYDFWIASFWQRIVDTSQFPAFRRAAWPSIPHSVDNAGERFWDLFTPTSVTDGHVKPRLSTLKREIVPIRTFNFKTSPWFTSIYYSSIHRVMWPKSDVIPYVELLPPFIAPYPYGEDSIYTTEGNALLDTEGSAIIHMEGTDMVIERARLYAVNMDDNYVFSEYFYTEEREYMSFIELLTHMMLMREVIDPKYVLDIANESLTWRPIERFYYTPIIISLLLYVKRRS